MANYNVGNIEIGISTNSSEATQNISSLIDQLNKLNSLNKSISNTFESINKLANGLTKIQNLNFSYLSSQFDKISQSTKDLNEKLSDIKSPKFGETATQLNKLSNAFRQFGKLKDFDFTNITENFNKLNTMLDPFLSKLKDCENSLVAMDHILNNMKSIGLDKTNGKLEKTSNEAKKTSDNLDKSNSILSKGFNLGKLYAIYNYAKRFVGVLSKMITYASDYIEILNKFQLSFGNLYSENLKLINQTAQAFGFSSSTLLDYTATFNNMLKGLKGLTDQTSAMISQTLTNMAIDYASLFNVSIDKAMTAFQSAISGNIRTIRSISGYDVSETTIYSVYQSLGGTKSMRQLNQLEKRLLRIVAIQQQMQQTDALGDYGRTISTVSNQIKIMKEQLIEVGKWIGMNLLVYLKPVIEYTNAILLTIKEMSKSLADVLQFTKDIDYESEFAGFSSDVDDATESVEELNDSLNSLPLDKINVLSNSDSTSSSVEGLSVEGKITDALKQYNMYLSNVSYKAKDISEKMLKWLGYYKQLNEETGEEEWKLSEGSTNLSKIIDSVKFIITYLVSSAILKKLATAFKTLKAGYTLLGSFANPIGAIVAVVALAIAGFISLYKKNENFKKSVDDSIKSIKENLKKLFNKLKEYYAVIKPALNFIWKLFSSVAGIMINKMIKYVQILAQLLNLDFKGAFNTLKSLIKDSGDSFASVFGVDNMKQVGENIGKYLSDGFNNAKDKLSSIFNKFLNNDIVGAIKETFESSRIAKYIRDIVNNQKIRDAFSSLKDVFDEIFQWTNDKIFNPIGNSFIAIRNKFKEIMKEIKEDLSNAQTWMNENVWKPIGNFGIVMLNGIISGFETAINGIIWAINKLTSGMSKIWEWSGIPAIGQINNVEFDRIPKLANGGVATQPTMALVGEYQNASSNPEIITPQNIMKQTFMDVLTPMVNAILNSNNKVVTAINTHDTNVYLNGRKVSENIYDDLQSVSVRKGNNVAVFGK